MLDVQRVVKSFGTRRAVDGLSLELRAGEILGLLGPNGAGKTTTVSMIAGLLAPDEGEVRIQGRKVAGDRDPLKRQLGFVPQELALFEELSAWENLALFGALQGLSGKPLDDAAVRVLTIVGLQDRARDSVAKFSGGMKRRLNLAVALLHDPMILILDEPTAGVDPQSRNAIFETLEGLRSQGKALLYTTHYMEEAERLCDRIIIMDEGRVLAEDNLAGLLRLLPSTGVLALDLDANSHTGFPLQELQGEPFVSSAALEKGRLRLGLKDLPMDTPRLLQWIGDRGLRWTHLECERASLENVFLALTGRSLRDA
jgi:ABC-2 type transport system ATP-binding protein